MIEPEIKQSILAMRRQGESFAAIAGELSLSPNTVKSICYRSRVQAMPAEEPDPGVCKNCGQPLVRIPGKKPKTFCSTHCRTKWWNKKRSRRPYRLHCQCCGREFTSFGNRNKKYCGRECCRLSRYGRDGP